MNMSDSPIIKFLIRSNRSLDNRPDIGLVLVGLNSYTILGIDSPHPQSPRGLHEVGHYPSFSDFLSSV